MRGWLARRDAAAVGDGFARFRRTRPVRLPQPHPPGVAPLAMPAVLTAGTVDANLALARDALRRVRIADRPLDDATATQCMALVTSRYVPDPDPAGPVLIGPFDDEPGRMLARAVTWLPDLPDGWATTDARFERFAALLDDALAVLAADPELLATAARVLNSIIVVDHPTQRAGVCSASLSHLWVSSVVVRDAETLADVIRGGVTHNALYFDELVHPKWAVDPQPLDDTKVYAPVPAFEPPMEYDTAFHAAHIHYLRLRAARATHPDFSSVRSVVAEMLEYPGHLTDHGRELLRDLDGLAASADQAAAIA